MAALEGLFAEDVAPYSNDAGMVRATRITVLVERKPRSSLRPSHFWKDVKVSRLKTKGQSSVLIFRNGSAVALLTVEA
jgi:hypothetical protein